MEPWTAPVFSQGEADEDDDHLPPDPRDDDRPDA